MLESAHFPGQLHPKPGTEAQREHATVWKSQKLHLIRVGLAAVSFKSSTNEI